MAITDAIDIDFQYISTMDPSKLIIMDTSVWGAIEDKPAIIEVTPPEKRKLTYTFQKGRNNIFNSSNLQMSATFDYNDMMDGIYEVTVIGSPDDYRKNRYILKTDKLRFDLAKAYLQQGIQQTQSNKDVKKILQTAEMHITDAENATYHSKLKRAKRGYKTARRIVDNYINCKDCK